MIAKKRRLRDKRILADRDLLLVEKVYQGRTIAHVAAMMGISLSLAYRRFKRVPAPIRDGIKRLVERHIREYGGGDLPDDAKEPLRHAMERAYGIKRRVG
jgi:AcrR family transcriptional regulator